MVNTTLDRDLNGLLLRDVSYAGSSISVSEAIYRNELIQREQSRRNIEQARIKAYEREIFNKPIIIEPKRYDFLD